MAKPLDAFTLNTPVNEVAEFLGELILTPPAVQFIEENCTAEVQELSELLAVPLVQQLLAQTWEYETNRDTWGDRSPILAVHETASHTMTNLANTITAHTIGMEPNPLLENLNEEQFQTIFEESKCLQNLFLTLLPME
jgi:hypothetical protein